MQELRRGGIKLVNVKKILKFTLTLESQPQISVRKFTFRSSPPEVFLEKGVLNAANSQEQIHRKTSIRKCDFNDVIYSSVYLK